MTIEDSTLHAKNLVQVGKGIVALARGEAGAALPSPEKGPDFLRGLGVTVPKQYQKVHFRQNSLTEFHFMVPAKALVEEALSAIAANQVIYDPDIYETYCQIFNGTSPLSREDQFYFRIGDYSIAHCR